MKNKTSTNGFTLPELLVVIVIAGILAGIVVTRLSSLSINVNGSATLLRGHLLQTKHLAITHMIPVGLKFDIARKQYQQVFSGDTDQMTEPLIVNMSIASLETNLRENALYFDTQGKPVDVKGQPYTNPVTLELSDSSTVAVVTVYPHSGYVE